MDDRGSITDKGRKFPPRCRVQVGFGKAHSASYTMRTGGGGLTGACDYPIPSSVEVKNAWNSTSSPPYVFMEWYLVIQRILHKENGTTPQKSTARYEPGTFPTAWTRKRTFAFRFVKTANIHHTLSQLSSVQLFI
jgi:hypothetical protein